MFDRIREIYKYNKANLNDVRFKLKYLCLPIFALFNILVLVGCLLVLIYAKNPIILISLLLSLSIASVVLFIILVKKVKQKEVVIEAEKLKNFFAEKLKNKPICEYVLPSDGSKPYVDLIFDKDGIKIDELSYSLDAFDVALCTSNFLYQVHLILMFSRNEKGDEQDADNNGVSRFTLPLDLNLLSILRKFKIEIKNPDVLSFIKESPVEASRQILNYGKLQDDYRGEKRKAKKEKRREKKEIKEEKEQN